MDSAGERMACSGRSFDPMLRRTVKGTLFASCAVVPLPSDTKKSGVHERVNLLIRRFETFLGLDDARCCFFGSISAAQVSDRIPRDLRHHGGCAREREEDALNVRFAQEEIDAILALSAQATLKGRIAFRINQNSATG